MGQFPPPSIVDHWADRIESLDDGFERLGPTDTPFTLRDGDQLRARAEAIHHDRDSDVQQRDKESNEPITRDLDAWADAYEEYDFPFVDTIPVETHRTRAEGVADIALQEGIVDHIDDDVLFEDETVRGRYWPGPGLIELGTTTDDFPGFRYGVVLAHELGHAIYDAWTPTSGLEDGTVLFRTDEQLAQARILSERLHGPMLDTQGPVVDYRFHDDGELAASVFASRLIEPQAAHRTAPDAVRRLENVFGPLSEDLF